MFLPIDIGGGDGFVIACNYEVVRIIPAESQAVSISGKDWFIAV